MEAAARVLLLLLAAVTVRSAAVEPADVGFQMGEEEHSFNVKPGEKFKVKIADFRSTGYAWYLDRLASGTAMLKNSTGGGDDEPPFILCEMSTSKDFAGGNISWVHVKPWELDDPNADRGYAVLRLKVKHLSQDAVLV
eukprot:TRINITY_DN35743_c0_g1_i1.p1 TRINITY_DN35743_c0_g1~~TRINITY_DN35743_c0_g1_i1.p1  ORF type:complete len:157 (+),score=37.08 TRINITY_DN35743_c0_g1_i1:60-473(+)